MRENCRRWLTKSKAPQPETATAIAFAGLCDVFHT
jgi:hypothetical protein